MPASSYQQYPPPVQSDASDASAPALPVAPAPATLWAAVPTCSAIMLFLILNQFSFQIATGPALVLLARRWGASAFYIGAITALTYWLQLLQLFTAQRVEYIGFRRLMLSGWTARTVVLLVVAALPFCTGLLSHGVLLHGLFWGMLFYNVLRGVVASSWLPWIRALVPEEWRGRYISAEQTTVYLSVALANFVCGGILGAAPTDFRFGVAFGLAFMLGWGSLYYLRRIHEPAPLTGAPPSENPLRWLIRAAPDVWRVRAMRRVVRLNMVIFFALSAFPTFVVVYMRDRLQVSDRMILTITGVGTFGSLASGWFWGELADRFGSRPVLALCTRLIGAGFLCWVAISVGALHPHTWLMMLLYMAYMAGYIGFMVGNNRYVLHYAPRESTMPAVTLFNVAQGTGIGVSPLIWGFFLDRVQGFRFDWGALHLNGFTLFFLLSLLILAASKALIRRLPEKRDVSPGSVLGHIMREYPARAASALGGLFPRARL